MTLQAFAFIALLLACMADAYSTNRLLDRGGYEKNLAWLIGTHPDPVVVWLVIGVLPVIVVIMSTLGIILFGMLIGAGRTWHWDVVGHPADEPVDTGAQRLDDAKARTRFAERS